MVTERQRTRIYYGKWRSSNRDKIKQYMKTWIEKQGYEEFRRRETARRKEYRKLPWIKTLEGIRNRINKAKNLKRWGNKYRCYVGILNFLTPPDLKFLWGRDNGAEMIKPSIDRKDSNSHYTLDNCQYVELAANRARVKDPGPAIGTIYSDGRVVSQRTLKKD